MTETEGHYVVWSDGVATTDDGWSVVGEWADVLADIAERAEAVMDTNPSVAVHEIAIVARQALASRVSS